MSDLENQGPTGRNRISVVLLVIMAFVFPPLPVFLLSGPNYTIRTKDFLISVLLTLFGHILGIVFALYLIFLKDTSSGYINLEQTPDTNDSSDASAPTRTTTIDRNGVISGPAVLKTSKNETLGLQELGSVAYVPYTDNTNDDVPPPNYEELTPGSSTPHPAVSDAKDTKVQS